MPPVCDTMAYPSSLFPGLAHHLPRPEHFLGQHAGAGSPGTGPQPPLSANVPLAPTSPTTPPSAPAGAHSPGGSSPTPADRHSYSPSSAGATGPISGITGLTPPSLFNSYPALFNKFHPGAAAAAAAAGGPLNPGAFLGAMGPRPPLPPPPPPGVPPIDDQDDVKDDPKVSLEARDLWAKFNSYGTEMVITKTGR